MKMHITIIVSAMLMLSSCASVASFSQAASQQKYVDGIYYMPESKPLAVKTATKEERDELVAKTKESTIFLKGSHTDTLVIPENKIANLKFNSDNSLSIALFDVDPFDNWYYTGLYRPYYWNRWYSPWSFHYAWSWPGYYGNPYHYWGIWSDWYYFDYPFYRSWAFYDPFFYDPFFYDPFFYGSPYFYGGYYGYGIGFGYTFHPRHYYDYGRPGRPGPQFNDFGRRHQPGDPGRGPTRDIVRGGREMATAPARAAVARTTSSTVATRSRLSSERPINDRGAVNSGVSRSTSTGNNNPMSVQTNHTNNSGTVSRTTPSVQRQPGNSSASTITRSTANTSRPTASASSSVARNTSRGTYSVGDNQPASRANSPSRSSSPGNSTGVSRSPVPSSGTGSVSRGGGAPSGGGVSRGGGVPSGGGVSRGGGVPSGGGGVSRGGGAPSGVRR